MKKPTSKLKRDRRHKKIRAKIFGTEARPRFSVFRSNKYIYAQLIDDATGKTLVAASSMKAPGKTVLEKAKAVGLELAKLAMAKKIKTVVFDRGGFIYTGKIKVLADSAREGGLVF